MTEPFYPKSYPPNAALTYVKNEEQSWVHITNLQAGEMVRVWLKPRHVLAKSVVQGVVSLRHKKLSTSGGIKVNHLTNIRGSFSRFDSSAKIVEVYMSPGAVGSPWDFTGSAILPANSISRMEVVRDRYDPSGTIKSVKYPRILSVTF